MGSVAIDVFTKAEFDAMSSSDRQWLKENRPDEYARHTGVCISKTDAESENKQGDNGSGAGMTKADLLKKPYNERLALYEKDPEGFMNIMKG